MKASNLTLIIVLVFICIVIFTLYTYNTQVAAIANNEQLPKPEDNTVEDETTGGEGKEGFIKISAPKFKAPKIPAPKPLPLIKLPPPPSFNPFKPMPKPSINIPNLNAKPALSAIVAQPTLARNKVMTAVKPPNYTTTQNILKDIRAKIQQLENIQKRLANVNMHSTQMNNKIIQANSKTQQYAQITYSAPHFDISDLKTTINLHKSPNSPTNSIDTQMKQKTPQSTVEANAKSIQANINALYSKYTKPEYAKTVNDINNDIKREIYGLDNVNISFLTAYYKTANIIDAIEQFNERLSRNSILIWYNSRKDVAWIIA